MSKPVILAVDDDRQVLAALKRDLRARYREDYTVVSADSGEEALATVKELKARGDELALTVSDQRMPGIVGVQLLSNFRDIYPTAGRVLLTAYSDIDAVVKGINDAHLHHYLSKPWDPPEDRLYPVLDDLLDEWLAGRKPEKAGLRLVGYQWSPRSHEVKDYLASNLIPYRWMDIELDPDAKLLLHTAGVGNEELPAIFFDDGTVLRNPQPVEVAQRLGAPLTASYDLYDLVVVGAGPAGLAAAVYGASEGLRTLLLDRHAPGGQAGASSKIENYLGFPAGVSGGELTRRAKTQAERFGAEILVPVEVSGLSLEDGYKCIALTDGRKVLARAMLVVTGMTYREHEAVGIADHAGAGVYYGAATTEAQAFRDRRVIVVGGGNSAGQSAMYLSRYAAEVQIVVRGDSLDATMSRYLIDQIAANPKITLRTRTVLQCVQGEGRVERATLFDVGTGIGREETCDAIFVMIGTRPHTNWLPPAVLRDSKGFVLTGRELMVCDAYHRIWKEEREPFLLETSVPGVFAAGDARAGSMNRVASAVGEGAMAVRLVHEYLALT
jgi:thioredoxin reductase (NADPH)